MPDFNMDSTFSVYHLVQRVQSDTVVINARPTMSLISHQIENATLRDGAKNVIFSSFQRMSKFLPQMNNYRKLAQSAQHVYVFGEMDVQLPPIPNITYIPLKPTDQLAKEWFIVSYGNDYFSALATEELSSIDDPDDQREFKGIWSFDLRVVSILHEWLSGIVGMRMEQQQDDDHNFISQLQLMAQTVTRIRERFGKLQDERVKTEVHTLVTSSLLPMMDTIKEKYPDVQADVNKDRKFFISGDDTSR